jgi:GNAT superfamily N-acetyltransferase
MVHILRLAAGGVHGPLTVDECRQNSEISRYLDRWSPDQIGLICTDRGGNIGAAWLTELPAEEPGYGFVAAIIPELTIGIAPDFQQQGHGSFLLASLLDAARRAGIRSISLSVSDDNERAKTMYQKAGFAPVAERDDSITMLRVG